MILSSLFIFFILILFFSKNPSSNGQFKYPLISSDIAIHSLSTTIGSPNPISPASKKDFNLSIRKSKLIFKDSIVFSSASIISFKFFYHYLKNHLWLLRLSACYGKHFLNPDLNSCFFSKSIFTLCQKFYNYKNNITSFLPQRTRSSLR